MEADYGARARHWNGIKNGVTGGWTSRDYNFQLISSSDSSSSEEDGASPAESRILNGKDTRLCHYSLMACIP